MINFDYIKGKNLQILDYGCGNGINTIRLLKAGHLLTSADINPECGKLISGCLSPETEERFKFIYINKEIEENSFENKFNVIICTETLEHINKYREVIKLFRRSIEDNGLIIVSVPTELSEKFFTFLDKDWLMESRHINVFKKKSIISEFAEHGFRLIGSEKKSSEWFIYWFLLKIFRVRQEMGIPFAKNRFQQFTVKFSNKLLRLFVLLKPLNVFTDAVLPKSIVLYFKYSGYDS